MSRPTLPSLVDGAALIPGDGAMVLVLPDDGVRVVAAVLEARLPTSLVDELAPEARASALAARDAVLAAARYASSRRSTSASGNAETVVAEVAADSVDQPVWLTTSEAGAELGLSDRRVRQLIEAGVLVGRQRGGRWLVERPSVLALKDARGAA